VNILDDPVKIASKFVPIASLPANLDRVREQIARAAERARRRADEITLVAISKTFPADRIHAAFKAGLHHFGENRVQEFESKQPALAALDATWHMIGHLQTNKARRAAHLFDRVDSVDDLSLAQKLDSAAAAEGKRIPILIEVRLGDEAAKSGAAESDLSTLAEAIAPLAQLELLGLMTIPPYFDDPARVRPYFRKLRELRDTLSRTIARPLPVLSMGMSHDFEIAIEEGSTEIRIGTALFGKRHTSIKITEP